VLCVQSKTTDMKDGLKHDCAYSGSERIEAGMTDLNWVILKWGTSFLTQNGEKYTRLAFIPILGVE